MGISCDQQTLSVGGARSHVLVIDDAREIRAVYCELLSEEGFQVSAYGCDDCDAATITQLAPDLIVLDGLYPAWAAGWSLLRTLKLTPEASTLPVVLCTAAVHEVKAHTDHLVAMGVPVVLKPFDIDDLLIAIRGALRRSPATIPRDPFRQARAGVTADLATSG